MLLTLKTRNHESSERRLRLAVSAALRSRRMRCPRRDFLLMQDRSGSHFDDIDDGIPLAVKLADLLGVDLQQHGDRVILPRALSVHCGKVDPPARNRVEDAHQRALRVAIADVKDL